MMQYQLALWNSQPFLITSPSSPKKQLERHGVLGVEALSRYPLIYVPRGSLFFHINIASLDHLMDNISNQACSTFDKSVPF